MNLSIPPIEKHSFPRINPYLVLLVAVSIIGIFPLLVPGYIITDDAGNHLYRLVAFDQALREGDLLPRWFPEFALGHGDAELNFYSPFSYFAAEFIHLLGFGLYYSLKLTFAASLVISGLGMYLWVSEVFGSRRAGFVAAVSYMFFPYHIIDIYFRGALAETVALVFLPFLLWSTFRLVAKGQRYHALVAGIFLALLVLSHNVTALFFMPIWLGYAALLILFGHGKAVNSVRLMVSNALGIGIATFTGLTLSVFYWLPALQEQAYASTGSFRDEGIVPAKQFSAFTDLIQTAWIFDYAQRPPKVGMIQMLAFLLGIVALVFILAMRKRWGSSFSPFIWQGIFFVYVVLVSIILMSPAGLLVWQTVPLAEYIQFPWRLLGFIGLGIAFLTGALALTGRAFVLLGLPMVALLVFSTMFQLSLPRIYLNEEDLTIPQAVRHEYDTGFVGGTCFKEYLPVWAKPGYILLAENPALLVEAIENRPSALSFSLLETRRDYFRLEVASENGGPLLLHQFFFPGWQARVDGLEVSTYPAPTTGLLAVDVPQGEHIVEVFFGNTPVRSGAGGVSLLVAAGVVGVCLVLVRRRGGRVRYATVVLFAGGVIFYLSPSWTNSPQIARGEELTAYSFRNEHLDLGPLRLAGFELDSRKAGTEGKVRVVLYWQSLGNKDDVTIRLNIKDGAGKTVGSRLTQPIYGTARTSLWCTDELVKDEYYIPVEITNPGRYFLEVSTEVESRTVSTGKLSNLELPGTNNRQSIPVSQPSDLNFGDKIKLDGYGIRLTGSKEITDKRVALPPGVDLDVTLLWKAINDIDVDYSVFLHLLDASGKRWEQKDAKPRAGFGLTSQWVKGHPMEDHYLIHLPESLPLGVYRLDIGVYNVRTMERLPIAGLGVNSLTLQSLKVIPKARIEEAPARKIDSVFGGAMRLVGASIGDDGSETEQPSIVSGSSDIRLPVKLSWRAENSLEKDYTVFIHLLDTSGKLVAQIDGQPRKGSYPTSFWSPGEDIPDEYEIVLRDLPPGEYQLRAGVYLRENLSRLATESGDDSILIGKIKKLENR